jgi:ornithine carbamoyltransferase
MDVINKAGKEEKEMNDSLRGRDYVSLTDLTQEEFWSLLETAKKLKQQQKHHVPHEFLKGKILAMIFEKASTRTRVSFESAMYHLGGLAIFLSSQDLQIGRGEPISDTARVLSSYCEGILIRTFKHQDVLDLAKYAGVPVVNGLTDDEHPTQALADLLTVWERKGKLEGLKLAFIGDGNNVAASLMHAGALTGMHIAVATPEGYAPPERAVRQAKAMLSAGASLTVLRDPKEAVKEADVVYTDVWASMGQEEEEAQRREAFGGYQVNRNLLRLAKPNAVVLHCLPAHRGEEITDEVMEGPQSVIFEEAENRLHAHKAILAMLL